MKTTKEIANELGVSKQRVYRYIKKNCINEAHKENGVMYYDEASETLIKQGFSENEAHQEVHQESHQEAHHDIAIDALVKQLEIKDKQIEELNKRLEETNNNLNQMQLQLIDFTSKVGNTLEAITQTQLADKLIEGKQVMDPVEPEQQPEPEKKSWWRKWFSL